MRYTTTKHRGAVRTTYIEPVDERVVRILLTAKLPTASESGGETKLSFYDHLALSGTKKRGKDKIESYLRKNGIVLSVTSAPKLVTYKLTTAQNTLGKALSILEEILFELQTPSHEFIRTKALILEEIREAHDDAREQAEINFINLLHAKNPKERRETLREQQDIAQKCTARDVKRVAADILKGEWYISFAGSKRDARKLEKLEERIRKAAQPVTKSEPMPLKIEKRSTFFTIPGKTNVELRMGNLVPITIRDDDYRALSFGLNVLGKMGGFAGRLMSTVREKEGLTYGIYTMLKHRDDVNTGYWLIFTFFTARDLKRGIESTLREVRRLLKDGITNEELRRFKEITRNQFLIAHESSERRIMLYHVASLLGQDEEALLAALLQTEALTKADVDAALRKYIDPDTLVISGAGPVTKAGDGIIA